jgi:phosphoserine phosphatase RsbX
MRVTDGRSGVMDWSVAERTRPGEEVSGDMAVVVPAAKTALVGVIDGLGHGAEAATAASTAARVVRERAGEPLTRLVELSHEALKQTRGVAMTLALFDAADATVTWVGVGNVEGWLVQEDVPGHSVMLAGGIAGLHLPPLQEITQNVTKGSILVLATDGVRNAFANSHDWSGAPHQIATTILERHLKGTDDALVLVARYRGEGPA